MAKKIVVVGSINLDLVATVKRMPKEGETLEGESFATYPGGKGANQAVGTARLGGESVLIGRLGSDGFGVMLQSQLQQAGVSMRCVELVEGSSGVAVVTVSEAGQNSIVVIPGANAKLQPADLDRHAGEFSNAAIVLAQLEIPMQTVLQAGRTAAKFGLPFILDPAPMQALTPELLSLVNWLTPNETEASALLRQLGYEALERHGSLEPEMAAERLLLSGVRNVIIKLGKQGLYVAGQDIKSEWIPALCVQAIDTTAAGDAFNAGFAYALADGRDAKQAANFANAVAAYSVTCRGAQPSMPSASELKRFVGSLGLDTLADLL